MTSLSDLASLVEVRNHILTVQNLNRSEFMSKEDWRKIDGIRLALDRKFCEKVLELDVDKALPNDLTIVKVGSASYQPSPQDLIDWRDLYEQAVEDDDFTIFTHNKISIEKYKTDDASEVRIVPSDDWLGIPKGNLNEPSKEEAMTSIKASLKLLEEPEGQLSLDYDKDEETEEAVETEAAGKMVPADPEVVKVGDPISAPVVDPNEDKVTISTTSEDDDEIAKTIAREKEKLKSQGRSNKKKATKKAAKKTAKKAQDNE